MNWIALLVAGLTGVVTVVNYFIQDYKIDASGNISIYETQPSDAGETLNADTLISINKTRVELFEKDKLEIKEDSILKNCEARQ